MVPEEKLNRFIPDFFKRMQIGFAHLKTCVTDFRQIVIREGVETETAVITAADSSFAVCCSKEHGEASGSVSRNHHETNGGVSEHQDVAIPDFLIRNKELIQIGMRIPDHGKLRMLTEHLGIGCRKQKLCAVHLFEKVGTADMIHMTMGVNDPADICRVKTGFPDRLHQHCSSTAVAGINQEQSVSGVDKVYTDPAVADIPYVAEDLEGMEVTGSLFQPDVSEWMPLYLLAAFEISMILVFHWQMSPWIIRQRQCSFLPWPWRWRLLPEERAPMRLQGAAGCRKPDG